MLKQLFTMITAVLLGSFILTGCGKDDPQPPAKTKSQLITQSSWKFQSATAAGTDITNLPAIACIKDDVLTFSSSGSGTLTEGVMVCNPTTASNFTWSFQSGETILVMSSGLFPGGAGTFTIVELTETNLKVSQNVTIPPSTTPVLVTAVYIH